MVALFITLEAGAGLEEGAGRRWRGWGGWEASTTGLMSRLR